MQILCFKSFYLIERASHWRRSFEGFSIKGADLRFFFFITKHQLNTLKQFLSWKMKQLKHEQIECRQSFLVVVISIFDWIIFFVVWEIFKNLKFSLSFLSFDPCPKNIIFQWLSAEKMVKLDDIIVGCRSNWQEGKWKKKNLENWKIGKFLSTT